MAAPGIAARAWGWLFHQPYLLLTLTTLAWAGNAVASRLAAGHISPMALTALRWVGVVALLAPFMTRPIREAAPVLVPIWRRILVMGGLGFTAFNALMYAAAYHTTAVNIAIFQGAVPVFVLIFGLVAFGTRIGLLQALGTALTLVGVGAIAARGDLQVLRSFSFLIGDVFMLIACASYAVYTLALRDRPKVSGFVFFSVLALAALMISLPLLAWEIAAGEVIWPDLRGFAILLYVTLFPSLLSQIFFMRGVELIGPSRAGLFVNLVPVFGAILGVAILGEPFRWYHAVGLALVLGGIWLAERTAGLGGVASRPRDAPHRWPDQVCQSLEGAIGQRVPLRILNDGPLVEQALADIVGKDRGHVHRFVAAESARDVALAPSRLVGIAFGQRALALLFDVISIIHEPTSRFVVGRPG